MGALLACMLVSMFVPVTLGGGNSRGHVVCVCVPKTELYESRTPFLPPSPKRPNPNPLQQSNSSRSRCTAAFFTFLTLTRYPVTLP